MVKNYFDEQIVFNKIILHHLQKAWDSFIVLESDFLLIGSSFIFNHTENEE